MSPSSGCVLLVEDNPLNQKLLARFLTARGFRVCTATTAAEAEASLGRELPGLVLMDVSLPGEDGLSLVRRIRAGLHPRAARVPIVAVTAHALAADRTRALEAGCQEHVSKPVDLRALEALVRHYLEDTAE